MSSRFNDEHRNKIQRNLTVFGSSFASSCQDVVSDDSKRVLDEEQFHSIIFHEIFFS